MKPKVTVIVPVYNTEKYLRKCLDSLVHQTLKEIKIICVDDGSTDGSAEILKDYSKKHKNIETIFQKNGGRSSARNSGLSKVKTPYVMFCDSDDEYAPKMCEKMVLTIEKNETDLAACEIKVHYEAHDEIKNSDENYYRLKYRGEQEITDEVIKNTDASVCDKVFRMDLIKQYKIQFPDGLNNEDYYFYNAYMSVAKTGYFLNEELYKYIRHEGSVMSDNFDRKKYSPDHLMIAKKLFDFYKKNGFLTEHTDLFWTQFAESFWFAYNHSVKEYRNKIHAIGKEFINKNFEKYPPREKAVKKRVNVILHYNLYYKCRNFALGNVRKVLLFVRSLRRK